MEELDTETKLAILQSLFADESQSSLLDSLLSHDGDVDSTATAMRKTRIVNLKHARSSDEHGQSPVGKRRRGSGMKADAQLEWSEDASKPKRKHEAVLELGPLQIEAQLPCKIMLNILPSSLAARLLKKMLSEASNWEQGYFKLFDRTVTSPHVAGFYLQTDREIAEHSKYVYNGQEIKSIRTFTSEMSEAHTIIEQRTRQWLDTFQRNSPQHVDNDWRANVAFANLYDGRDSAVGYHSDQLTYLGPLPTIASLSLGCEREFRLKSVSGSSRTFSIRLPHNSLFIMGPGCQEDYKHSIHPVSRSRGLDLHSIAGVKRINITYRQYRKEFEPRNLPRCVCGQTVLRSAKTKDNNLDDPSLLWHGRRYFWHCDGDKNPQGTGCGYFQWARFGSDGRPLT